MTGLSDPDRLPPILAGKDYAAASVFTPSNLLREARRQKGLAAVRVPEICVLDPDGDILRRLRRSGYAQRLSSWACYHTELFAFDHEGEGFGIIGCAVSHCPVNIARRARFLDSWDSKDCSATADADSPPRSTSQ